MGKIKLKKYSELLPQLFWKKYHKISNLRLQQSQKYIATSWNACFYYPNIHYYYCYIRFYQCFNSFVLHVQQWYLYFKDTFHFNFLLITLIPILLSFPQYWTKGKSYKKISCFFRRIQILLWDNTPPAALSAWRCAKCTGAFLVTYSCLRCPGGRQKRRGTGAGRWRQRKIPWPEQDPQVCPSPPCRASTSHRPTPTGEAPAAPCCTASDAAAMGKYAFPLIIFDISKIHLLSGNETILKKKKTTSGFWLKKKFWMRWVFFGRIEIGSFRKTVHHTSQMINNRMLLLGDRK